MSANLENSAVATELEKVSFHSNPKDSKLLSHVWLCDSMDYVHGMNSPGQNTGVGSLSLPFSSKSSQPRFQTQVSRIAGGLFTSWDTRKAQSQRRTMSKNVPTTAQLHSFHMLAK